MNYRPRVAATLTVPVLGSSAEKDRQSHGATTVSFPIRIVRCTLERNDHLQADTCRITAEYRDANIDPRFLKHATIQLWMGDADSSGPWHYTDNDLRFIGICVNAHRKTAEGGFMVEMEFRDYTTLFIAQKPYPQKYVPDLSMSLKDAWRLICDHTGYWDVTSGAIVSNVAALAGRLEFRGDVDPDIQIGAGVVDRIRAYGKISARSGDSAWDVWQRVIFGLGLVSWIDKDKCIVSTSTELFSVKTAPALIYGVNILEADESVDTTINSRGIQLVSLDIHTGHQVEVFYPPPGDPRIHVKRAVARRKNYNPNDLQSDQYEIFEFHEVSDEKILKDIARRAYDERSRQEIQGYVKTAEMRVLDPLGQPVDLLNLGAGDCVRIQIDDDSTELLKNYGSEVERIAYLIKRGYEPGVAQLIVRNLDAMPNLSPVFHTRQITVQLDENDFSITINYWNRILFSGDSDDK